MSKITTRQRLTFKELLESVDKEESFNLKDLMIKAGYSEATAKNPAKNLIKKEGWNQLLAQIDDTMILTKFYEILMSDDKRSSMDAGKELLKLKDRYPASKSKIIGLFDSLSNLEEPNPKEQK